MSILETFYILFKSDASNLIKGNEEAEKSTKKLTESLKKIDTNTEKIGSSFLNIARAFAGIVTAAVSTASVIGGIKSATEYAIELGNISRQLGVNVVELDAWGNAVRRVGGTAQGFQQSLKSLSEHLGGNATIALKVLPQLADVFHRLNSTLSTKYGKQLGLDESTILLLQHGRREVEAIIKQQKELGLITKQDAETAFKFNMALQDLELTLRRFFFTINADLLPSLALFLNATSQVVNYLIAHKDLITGALYGMAGAIIAFAAPIVVANFSTLLLISAIGALIAAFAIFYEDLQVYLKGGDSLIGDFIRSLKDLEKTLSNLSLLKISFPGLSPLFKAIDAMKWLKSFFAENHKFTIDLQGAENILGQAGSQYLGSSTSNLFNSQSAFNRSNSITTGPITINTRATDAPGIASSLTQGLNEHAYWQSNSQFDDGMAI